MHCMIYDIHVQIISMQNVYDFTFKMYKIYNYTHVFFLLTIYKLYLTIQHRKTYKIKHFAIKSLKNYLK